MIRAAPRGPGKGFTSLPGSQIHQASFQNPPSNLLSKCVLQGASPLPRGCLISLVKGCLVISPSQDSGDLRQSLGLYALETGPGPSEGGQGFHRGGAGGAILLGEEAEEVG